MLKKLISLLLVGGALALPFGLTSGVAQASYTGTDSCGLKMHTCDTHQNGKYYTEAITFHSGMHAYQTAPACNLVPDGNVPPNLVWRITSAYRVMPYSADIHVSGTCPNCTYQLYCGTDASHVNAIETD